MKEKLGRSNKIGEYRYSLWKRNLIFVGLVIQLWALPLVCSWSDADCTCTCKVPMQLVKWFWDLQQQKKSSQRKLFERYELHYWCKVIVVCACSKSFCMQINLTLFSSSRSRDEFLANNQKFRTKLVFDMFDSKRMKILMWNSKVLFWVLG